MIVLDEQLQGRGIDRAIADWYRGAVCIVTDLRPATVVKDDSVPLLLQREDQPTFVTINETDFWRKVEITGRFCVVCVGLPLSRAAEVASLLRRILSNPEFKTKSVRMGKVARVSPANANWYSAGDRTIRRLADW